MAPHQPQPQHNLKPASTYGSVRTVFAWLLSAVLCLAVFLLLSGSSVSPLLQYIASTYNQGASTYICDYSEGQWVSAPGHARRYNATECNVKEGQNCVWNGRPDSGYLDWRWQPAASGCQLPAFDAAAFLAAVRDKHVAFIGDSLARNQAESLVCLLAASFPYRLVYGERRAWEGAFWRWAFPSHNVTVSVYWAPFLARATGRPDNYKIPDSSVFLDAPADRWSAEADTIDVAVVSAGHWFFLPTIYYTHNGSEVLGTHRLPDLNHTEIGISSTYREVIRMTIRRLISSARARTVVVSTFSPPHFEKDMQDPTTCARKVPYKEGEKEVDAVHAELRGIVREEVAAVRNGSGATRVEVMDVTKLATMRPDGHPGVYMKRDPWSLARGVPKRLPSDCLHFCLPGPVDTFNEILLQLLTKRR